MYPVNVKKKVISHKTYSKISQGAADSLSLQRKFINCFVDNINKKLSKGK